MRLLLVCISCSQERCCVPDAALTYSRAPAKRHQFLLPQPNTCGSALRVHACLTLCTVASHAANPLWLVRVRNVMPFVCRCSCCQAGAARTHHIWHRGTLPQCSWAQPPRFYRAFCAACVVASAVDWASAPRTHACRACWWSQALRFLPRPTFPAGACGLPCAPLCLAFLAVQSSRQTAARNTLPSVPQASHMLVHGTIAHSHTSPPSQCMTSSTAPSPE